MIEKCIEPSISSKKYRTLSEYIDDKKSESNLIEFGIIVYNILFFKDMETRLDNKDYYTDDELLDTIKNTPHYSI